MNWKLCITDSQRRALDLCGGSMDEGDGYCGGYADVAGDGYGNGCGDGYGNGCVYGYGAVARGGTGWGYGICAGGSAAGDGSSLMEWE